MKTALNLLLLVGLLLIPLRVQAQAPLPPGGEAGAQTALYTMRLPVVMQQEPLGQINGQVLEQGQPVAGVKVSLYAFVVGSASQVAVATTEADGTYCFPNVPSLPEEGRLYAVRFSSGEQKRFGNNPSQLWKWETRHIAEFAPGASFTFPPFDIANIELRASTSSRVQSFPIVFTWTPRPQSPRDSYQLVIEDPSTGEEWQSARTLGYTDHYQLEALPTDRDSGTSFQTGKEYLWSIHIYDSVAGGSGYDSHSSRVTFPPTLTGSGQINGHVLEHGQAAAGVKVNLTHYGDYELETLATTTTLEDGSYRFAQVPALPADQKYTVRFENEEDPNRLGFWETKEIVQFSAGETFSYAPFDIGNILLVAPAAQAFPHLPIDFTWTPRAFAPQDSYILDLSYNNATKPLQSYPVLQANHYQLDSLPANIYGGDGYWWQVSISDTVNGGGGHGFEKRAITLYPYLTGTGQIHGQVREQGQPAAGVTVTLHGSWLRRRPHRMGTMSSPRSRRCLKTSFTMWSSRIPVTLPGSGAGIPRI
jgi:5-hydroxyisourate hydrolase-like protein (transthyretin family)